MRVRQGLASQRRAAHLHHVCDGLEAAVRVLAQVRRPDGGGVAGGHVLGAERVKEDPRVEQAELARGEGTRNLEAGTLNGVLLVQDALHAAWGRQGLRQRHCCCCCCCVGGCRRARWGERLERGSRLAPALRRKRGAQSVGAPDACVRSPCLRSSAPTMMLRAPARSPASPGTAPRAPIGAERASRCPEKLFSESRLWCGWARPRT